MFKFNLNNQHGRIPVWLGAAIIIIVLGVTVWLIIANTGRQQPVTVTQPPPVQAEPVLSYVGVIQSISDNQLQLLVPASRNGLSSDKLVTVLFDGRTTVTRRTIPRQIPANITGAQRQALFSQASISPSELQIGDDITVVAASDISQASSFTAVRMQVRQVK